MKGHISQKSYIVQLVVCKLHGAIFFSWTISIQPIVKIMGLEIKIQDSHLTKRG